MGWLLSSWWSRLGAAGQPRIKKAGFRLHLEPLEDRLVPTTLQVVPAASANGLTAFATLTQALSAAQSGDTIRIDSSAGGVSGSVAGVGANGSTDYLSDRGGSATNFNIQIASANVLHASYSVIVSLTATPDNLGSGSFGSSGGFTLTLGMTRSDSVPDGDSAPPPQTVTVIVSQPAHPEVSGERMVGATPQVATVSAALEHAPVTRPQTAVPGAAAALATRIVSGFFATNAGASGTAESTAAVGAVPTESGRGPAAADAPPPPAAEAVGPPASDNSPELPPPPTQQVVTTLSFGDRAPDPAVQADSFQVGMSAPESGTMSVTRQLADFVPGKVPEADTPGDKDAGLAQAAAQRKALALGLRYLYPDMTDDEIAQSAGVSRRTLFRWEEYTTLKKVQREVYKRPRGTKDREGNLEAWTEEEDE